jgi:predicted RecB family nuclease
VTITTDLFNAYLHCPSKSWLRSLRGPSGANSYAEWAHSNAQFYRREGLKRLLRKNPSVECSTAPTEPMSWKAEKWLLAVEVTVRAFSPSESYTLESFIDAIERVSSPGRGKSAQFIPVRFIPANKPTKNDRLLLAFDAWVLSRALRREVKWGTIIHGEAHIAQTVKTIPLTSELQKLLGELAALLSSQSAPDLVLNRHCAECEFRPASNLLLRSFAQSCLPAGPNGRLKYSGLHLPAQSRD